MFGHAHYLTNPPPLRNESISLTKYKHVCAKNNYIDIKRIDKGYLHVYIYFKSPALIVTI